KYSVHPGADKMYYDLRDRYWWPGIKKDIAELREDYKMERLARLYFNEIVARHGVQEVLAVNARGIRDSFRHEYDISPSDPWSDVRCALFEALYGRKCRLPIMWAEVGEVPLDEIRVDAKLNFVEELWLILERFKKLKRSRIAIVKVRWNSKCGPEFTS
ncbi:putative reverse transcriptase domain-containing protein, partial [Tanacetum coccineum]